MNPETQKLSLREKILFLLFISIFYSFGFFAVWLAITRVQQANQVETWPTTAGELTKVEFLESPFSESEYRVSILYSYTVDGVRHEGSTLAYGYGASSGRRLHDEIYETLHDVKKVAVRYDPIHPENSCLSCGLNSSILSTIVFAIVWNSVMLCLTMMGIFGRKDTILLDNLIIDPPG
ncbi:MAG: DUF3592 domain-containing protein [Fimbriiglobus sp.]